MKTDMNRDSWYGNGVDDNVYRWHHSFGNGYGASVVSARGTYGWHSGLFEVAVTHGSEICYRTSITDDVLGHLTHGEVAAVLRQVENLDRRDKCDHRATWRTAL